jgi:hypothetical protein
MTSAVRVKSVPAPTVKIRKSGVPEAALRATVSTEAPGPITMMLVDRSGRAVSRVIVPVTAGAKSIVSGPDIVLARSIAFPQRAGTRIVRVQHRDHAGHHSAFQALDVGVMPTILQRGSSDSPGIAPSRFFQAVRMTPRK